MATAAARAESYHNFIDGAWAPSVSANVFENRNPANADDVVGLFQKSTSSDVQHAIAAASRAYASWRLTPAPRRQELLFRAAQLIADRREDLARDMTREMGKVLDDTRGDVQEAIDMTFFIVTRCSSATRFGSCPLPARPKSAVSCPKRLPRRSRKSTSKWTPRGRLQRAQVDRDA